MGDSAVCEALKRRTRGGRERESVREDGRKRLM